MWHYALIHGVYAVAILLLLWAVATLSPAGRTPAWWGMLIAAAVALIPNVTLAYAFMTGPSFRGWHLSLGPLPVFMPVLFGACFALYVRRLNAIARRAHDLEEECAGLAARLDAPSSFAPAADIPLTRPDHP